MQGEETRIALVGTAECPEVARAVTIGNLSLLVDSEAIRAICWNGAEVVRALNWPVRDESWITLPQTVQSINLETDENQAHLRLNFSVADGALECLLLGIFSESGSVKAELTISATRDFFTNRAGFTLLHPIEGVAGERLTIIHSDGSREDTHFPRYISPSQPALDITGLSHSLNGIAVDIAFDGEVFEMEDQRNWTDASFKTYCRPLVFPFTYRIAKGESVRQSIEIAISGEGSDKSMANIEPIELAPNGALPNIALAAEPGWLADSEFFDLLKHSGMSTLQARLDPSVDTKFLEQAGQTARNLNLEMDLEVVVPKDTEPEDHFRIVKDRLGALNIEPVRILAVPEPYLKSYQPSGPWPDGPQPDDCVVAARKIFSTALIGGGMLTNFTEFNRCPPDLNLCDFIGHGTTAIVHAADDRSVCETVEALSHVFESANNMAAEKPYRLGLLTIGMRSNPYGADVAANPNQIRQTMARFDPRQCGTFAAAFAVGVLNATQGYSVEALALAAPYGPFGIIAQKQPVERAYFDSHPKAAVYPLFHVVRMAAEMAKHQRLGVGNLPAGLRAVAAGTEETWEMMISNLSDQSKSVRLPTLASVRSLSPLTFDEAVHDPNWLVNAESQKKDSIEIEPYTVAFVSAKGAAI